MPLKDPHILDLQYCFALGGLQVSWCAGPCIGLDTACSSSLVAAHLAARGLLDSETSAAVAAGVNLMLVPGTFTHMAQLGALSPTGRSKSLDAAADGYGRGEGCIAVIMRRPGRTVIADYSPLAMMQGIELPRLLFYQYDWKAKNLPRITANLLLSVSNSSGTAA